MSTDHDAIDELLAGYVLRSLEGPDATEADRLLVEHVPGCATCRITLEGFVAVTGELGASVRPLQPSPLLLPRLHEEIEPRRTRRLAGWSPARLVAVAAAVVVLVGVAGLAITSGGGGGQSLAQADLSQIRSIAALPGAQTTHLGQADEVTAPGLAQVYVMGTSVASPPSGMIYRLWAIGPSGTIYLGDFAPVNGIVALQLTIDPTTAQLLVTVEPADSDPGSPGQPAWPAA